MPDANIYFECSAGGSGGGATLEVSYGEEFYGKTLTATNGTKTLTKVAGNSGTVTFKIPESGNWTVSGVVDGTTYSVSESITLEYTAALASGFDYKAWLVSAGVDPTSYSTLDDVFADEELVRKLLTIHDSVDYMADFAAVNTELETVLNNDICAKWINLSDYALDTLKANVAIATEMATADKYGYGEWVIVDDTTTPPTWGPKDAVPVMTSNSAPYGEAGGQNKYSREYYYAFDGNDGSNIGFNSNTTGRLWYKFTNPINPKRIVIWDNSGSSGVDVSSYKVIGSNDGSTWETIATFNENFGTKRTHDLSTNNYYLYVGVEFATGAGGAYVSTLQFYGRQLSVSVPVMTSNTAPYGEVLKSSEYNSNLEGWKAFDNNSSTKWSANGSDTDPYVGYDFGKKVVIKEFQVQSYDANNKSFTYLLKGSNDKQNWTPLMTEVTNSTPASLMTYSTDHEEAFRYIALFTKTVGSTGCDCYTLQFYGLDYSEKEFEQNSGKKWLYDHGVELVTLEECNVESTYFNDGYVEKGESSIKVFAASANYGGWWIGSQMDLSDYSLARAKIVGAYFYNSQSMVGLGVYSSKTPTSANRVAQNTLALGNGNLPSNISLDISNINQTDYVCFEAGNNQGGSSNRTWGEFNELWVE